MKSKFFICLKSYGDILISIRCLSGFLDYSSDSKIHLIVPGYAKSLIDELFKYNLVNPRLNIIMMNIWKKSITPLYNVKSSSIIDIFFTTISIFKFLWKYRKHNIIFAPPHFTRDHLLFPLRITFPKQVNVYEWYYSLPFINIKFNRTNYNITLNRSSMVTIFHESSASHKNIPIETLNKIISFTSAYCKCRIICFDKDTLDGFQSSSVVYSDKEFKHLFKFITESDLVVTADSLPCHVSSALRKNTFVFQKQYDLYWIPPDIIDSHGFSTFNNIGRYITFLNILFDNDISR